MLQEAVSFEGEEETKRYRLAFVAHHDSNYKIDLKSHSALNRKTEIQNLFSE